MTLAQLDIGDIALVKKFKKFNSFSKRMLDIGLIKNFKIKVINFAPLGDPIAVEVNSTIISIRKEDAKNIEVKVLSKRLANLKKGQSGIITHFYGGLTFLKKMKNLNIKIGNRCKMIDNSIMPLKVEINGILYNLPYGMALKIQVDLDEN